jgi:hypothetical protein
MADGTQAPKDLTGFLDFYLVQKAPFQLPDGVREFLVKYGPWIMLVFMVLSIPAILFVLGIGTFAMPFGGMGYAAGFGIAVIGMIITFALNAMALPGLFARKVSGWTLLFYGELVSIATSLLQGAVISAVIGGLIGLYILFQIRGLYK